MLSSAAQAYTRQDKQVQNVKERKVFWVQIDDQVANLID